MTATAERIAAMARKVIISYSPSQNCHFLIVDLRTPEGERYDLCYSSTNTPIENLFRDLKGILPSESVSRRDCELIIESWAERAHEHKVEVPA